MTASPEGETTGRILIAFDGSPAARAAVGAAARLFGGRATVVVSVWQSAESVAPAAMAGAPAGVIGEAAQKLDQAAEAETDGLASEGAELARGAGLDAEPRAVRAEGSVWSTICRSARDLDAVAVVLGSRGRSGMRSVLLGSVSNAVVQHAEQPTLVVHENESSD